jgi:hypothetical protein
MRKFFVGLVALTAMMSASVFAADVGTKADVAGVRAAVHQKFPREHVSTVRVAGDYAFVGLWEQAGPETVTPSALYKRISGERWKLLSALGGGAAQARDLIQNGVPASVAHQLCPHKFCN